MSVPTLVNAWDSDDALVTYTRDGERVVRKVMTPEWVMFLRASDVTSEIERNFRGSVRVRSIAREGDWFRIGFRDREAREAMVFGIRGGPKSPLEESGIERFEGDVRPVRRMLTDTGALIQRPRRCYLDFEGDSRVPFSRKEESRILGWAVEDDIGNKKSWMLAEDTDRCERDGIYALFEWLEKYDQVGAWNGDNYDFPLLRARAKGHGCKVDFMRLLWLDALALYKRMNVASESGDEKASLKLGAVAESLFGDGKDDFDASKTWEAWIAGGESRERLHRYMCKDTSLLPRIEAKTGFAELLGTLAEVCRVFPDSRGLNPTAQMDGYMLRLGRERDIRFPSKRFYETSDKFAGAYVMQPKAYGIMRDVHVADFASLYPSIILTWNMSPETKREHVGKHGALGTVPAGRCVAPGTGQTFDDKADGILPIALRELIRMRKVWNEKKAACPPGTPEWKEADRRSTAYKVAANSFYGVVGSMYSRFYDKAVAESVTQNGVWLIKQTIEAAEDRGMHVIYGDTDSLMATGASEAAFGEFVSWCNAELYPHLLRERGCSRNEIKLAYEKAFERIVFCGAKRYAGKYLHYKGKRAREDSRPEVRGLEYRRGDAARLARALQIKAVQMVMAGVEAVGDYRHLVHESLEHVLHDDLLPEEVCLTKAITKDLRAYDAMRKVKKDGTDASELAHVRVAKQLLERGREVGEGTRIEYYVVNGADGLVVAPSEDWGKEPYDRFYLWEHLVYPPTMRFLQAAFPLIDWTTGLEKVRPAKIPARFRSNEKQLSILEVTAPTRDVTELFPPVIVRIAEGEDREIVSLVKLLARQCSGRHPVQVHIALRSGAAAVMDLPDVRVRPGDSFPALVSWHSAMLRRFAEDMSWR